MSTNEQKLNETVDFVMSHVDKDGSGSISPEELKRFMNEVGDPMTIQEAREVVHKLDQDGNQTLDKEELREFLRPRFFPK